MIDLVGKVAIVTGASRGIGRHIALALANEGADVVCAARTTDIAPAKLPGTIEETARQVEAIGQRALAVACDIRSAEDVRALVDKTISAFGRIDLVVNNAAVNVRAPFLETTQERWALMLDVNLGGSVNCIRAALPHIIERGGGSILNLSSGAVTMPEISAQLGITGYAVSKAAIEKLTEILALELQPKGVSLNCLRIESAVVTEGALAVDPDGDYAGWEKPEVVADAALWLATRPPEFTGRIMTVGEIRRERASVSS